MRGRRLILVAMLLSILSAAETAAHFSAEMTPLPTSGDEQLFRPVQLAVDNHTNRTIRSLRLRWQHGGPTIVIPAALAPQQEVELTVHLPAIATTQTFDLIAVADDRPDAGNIAVTATIVWPGSLDRAGGLIAPNVYDRLAPHGSVWSGRQRQRIVLFILAAGLLLAGAAMIRRPARRNIALALIVMLCAVGVGVWASVHGYVNEQLSPNGRYVILHSRRTITWRTRRTDLIPLYASRQHLMEDTTVVDSAGMTLTLPAGQVQLLLLPDN